MNSVTVMSEMAWYCHYLDSNSKENDEHIALEYRDQKMSYGELRRTSQKIRHVLIHKFNIKKGQLIGVLSQANPNFIATIHAIWECGATYVPLDPDLPKKRLEFILEDSGISCLVTNSKYKVLASNLASKTTIPTSIFPLPDLLPKMTGRTDSSFDPSVPAYMIYTSGSTGKPKGVLCSHHGLHNLCQAVIPMYDLGYGKRCLQFAKISFDGSMWEIFFSLYSGSTLILADRDQLMPGERLARFIEQNRITHLALAPSILSYLNSYSDHLSSVTHLTMAGESCPPYLAEFWMSDTRSIFNSYGPTESTVCATMHQYTGEKESVPIGEAIEGAMLYLENTSIDEYTGHEVGELWVSGDCLAYGYHNRPKLNEERFVLHPRTGERCYRTGDLVYYDNNGLLHFIGRNDRQVKVRGLRIELDAIEHAAYGHPQIKSCASKLVNSPSLKGVNSKQIALFYTSDHLLESELRNFLLGPLPSYAIPNYLIEVDKIPMTANLGKIDYNSLPDEITSIPSKSTDENDGIQESRSPIDALCALFKEVIGDPNLVIQESDDFFQCGGDSIGVAFVLVGIEEQFSAFIPSHVFYENSTPRKLLDIIEKVPSNETCMNPFTKESGQVLMDHSAYDLPELPHHHAENRSSIFLTGGTGFLGINLLYSLIKQESVKEVICLVRASDEFKGLRRLIDSFQKYGLNLPDLEKVHVVCGDITQDLFGLPDSQYDHFSSRADCILHCAASINYITPYSNSSLPNSLGTKNVLDFATNKKVKSFHHISTMGVYGPIRTLTGQTKVYEDFDLDESLPFITFENGYTKAKWVAEKMVTNARDQGLPVSIYRPGFIQGDHNLGISNINDAFCSLIIGNIQLGFYPDFPDKYWLPIPVDFVSQAIIYIALNCDFGHSYNVVPARNEEPSNNQIFSTIREMGYPLKKIHHDDWREKLLDLPPDNALYPLRQFMREKVFNGVSTIFELHHITPITDRKNLLAALEGIALPSPVLDEGMIKKYIKYFVSLGLISEVESSANTSLYMA